MVWAARFRYVGLLLLVGFGFVIVNLLYIVGVSVDLSPLRGIFSPLVGVIVAGFLHRLDGFSRSEMSLVCVRF